MLPDIAVLIPTYNRREILTKGLNLLRENLKYEGKIKVFVGDDSDNEDLAYCSVKDNSFVEDYGNFEIFAYHNVERRGLGANLNILLNTAQVSTDYVIQMDDDHWLIKPLDITPHVQKLIDDPTAGCIRLMHVAGHRYRATLDNLYWRIDWESPEVYIASNRPHLKSISRFHETYGYYTEGLKLGLTEETFCHNCIDTARRRAIMGARPIDVLIPLDVQTESGWDHVGHSYQLQGY